MTSLVVNDDVVVTDLARDRAMKLGFELVREDDKPPSAPERPYSAKNPAPTTPTAAPKESKLDMEQKVTQAVKARLGDTVDDKLLETVIKRVLKSVGKS